MLVAMPLLNSFLCLPLLPDAMGWSEICDCAISWPYTLLMPMAWNVTYSKYGLKGIPWKQRLHKRTETRVCIFPGTD